jgi:hypothetical protein
LEGKDAAILSHAVFGRGEAAGESKKTIILIAYYLCFVCVL